MLLLLSLGWLVGVTFLLALLMLHARGYKMRWRRFLVRDAELPTAAVVAPVRNEARNIERCLTALMAQSYPAERLRIVVVDDGSTDGTPDLVRRLAAGDPRVLLIEAGPLPEGWAGKPHACLRGARMTDSEWLCFVDADTMSRPHMLRRAIALAQRRAIDMLSLVPLQQLTTFWERLVLPAQFLLFTMFMDLHRVNDPRAPDAVANGQCILIRRAVYDATGGHAAVRGEVLEDVALARLVKHKGHHLYMTSGIGLIRTRMYKDLREIWNGFSKNSVDLIGGVPGAVAGALIMLLTGWVPVVLATVLLRRVMAGPVPGDGTGLALLLSLGGIAELLGAHIAMDRYNRVPILYSLLFPLRHTAAAALTLNSVRHHLLGRKEWKGRIYAPGAART